MAEVILTDSNFEQDVIKSDMPILVDFWAPWCAPCRIISPIVEELGKEYEGKIKVGKMNVDDNPNSPSRFGIMSIPTLIIFKNGNPAQTIVGAQGKDKIKRAIEDVLAS